MEGTVGVSDLNSGYIRWPPASLKPHLEKCFWIIHEFKLIEIISNVVITYDSYKMLDINSLLKPTKSIKV